MIFHPLVIGYLALDALVIALLAWHLKSLLHAAEGRADEDPRTLTSRTLTFRTIFAAVLMATILVVLTITEALPGLVAGAMCGKGVLKATDGYGLRAIVFQLVAVAALTIWSAIDRLPRSEETPSRAETSAKAALFAYAPVLMGIFESVRMLWHLDVDAPVSCCSAVAASASMGLPTSRISAILTTHWIWLYAASALGLVLWNAHIAVRRSVPFQTGLVWIYGLGTIAWTAVAGAIVVFEFGDVLGLKPEHQCLWCLFRDKCHYAGYPIFGSLFVLATGGLAQITTARLAPNGMRRHGIIALVALGVFVATTLLPLILST